MHERSQFEIVFSCNFFVIYASIHESKIPKFEEEIKNFYFIDSYIMSIRDELTDLGILAE